MSSPASISVQRLARRIGLPDAPVLLDLRLPEEAAADPRILPASLRRDHAEAAARAPGFRGRAVADRFGAEPFDIEGVRWSHRRELCSLDVRPGGFGLRSPAPEQVATGMALLDAFPASCRDAVEERHGWPAPR